MEIKTFTSKAKTFKEFISANAELSTPKTEDSPKANDAKGTDRPVGKVEMQGK
jgi:hypothetical protein